MISVIIPIYNAELKLERCINSVLNQTYKDIEVLLVDDGSKDNSSTICKEYESKDDRVRYYRKENGGSASARNYGIDKASGDFLQFVDSDDYIDATMIEELTTSQNRTDADWVICGMRTISPYRVTHTLFGKADGIDLDGFKEFVVKYYSSAILHSSCNKLYRRSLVKSRMNPDYRWGEDLVFNLQYLLRVSRVSIIPQAFYNYDCTMESVTRGKYIRQADYIVQRYYTSKEILQRVFDSSEIESILINQFGLEMIADYTNATPLLKVSKTEIEKFLSPYRHEFAQLKANNRKLIALKSGNYFSLKHLIVKEKLSKMLKTFAKKIIKR